MNVFVLTTGRSGSLSFTVACQHMDNYSVAHESRCHLIGEEHFNYPANHIEADNRLSWFLGTLDKRYGANAFYVHLKRNEEATAKSFLSRYEYDFGMIKAYRKGILLFSDDTLEPLEVCHDYYQTVNDNITHFLKDKPRQLTINLENVKTEFPLFWEAIEAQGNLAAAMDEWNTPKNTWKEIHRNGGGLLLKIKRYFGR